VTEQKSSKVKVAARLRYQVAARSDIHVCGKSGQRASTKNKYFTSGKACCKKLTAAYDWIEIDKTQSKRNVVGPCYLHIKDHDCL
jgi:hypothetical protein